MALERLDKILSSTGRWSRKEIKDMIRHGRVRADGTTAAKPEEKFDPASTHIQVDGQTVDCAPFVYVLMHKPAGLLSATRDPKQKTVLDLLPQHLRRRGLFPVGRLDKDTEGFVLITDDGAFAHRILAPKNKLPKRYTAVLDHRLDPAVIGEFEKGVDIGSGDHTLPAELTILENGENPRVSVIICEGMYHQIKRMFERFGYQVIYLKREQIGGLPLDPALPKGACRELTEEELRRLEGKEGEDAQ